MGKSNKEKLYRRDIIFILSILIIPVVQFLIFYVYVNLNSFAMAFQNTVDGIDYSFVGFDTIIRAINTLFNDVNYIIIMKNTLVLYLFTGIIMQVLCLIISYFVWKKVWAWKFFSIVLFLPSVISNVAFVMIVKKLVNGFLPHVFNNLEIVKLFNPLETGFIATTILLCMLSFGSNLVLYLGSMSQVDSSIVEAGQLDGMNSFHEFVYIIFPHVWPTIISMFVIGIAGMLTNQGLIISYYGTGSDSVSVMTFGVKLYVLVLGKSYGDYTMISAMGLIFTIALVIVTGCLKWAMEKFGPRED